MSEHEFIQELTRILDQFSPKDQSKRIKQILKKRKQSRKHQRNK